MGRKHIIEINYQARAAIRILCADQNCRLTQTEIAKIFGIHRSRLRRIITYQEN